jgi:hypothetical protein
MVRILVASLIFCFLVDNPHPLPLLEIKLYTPNNIRTIKMP